MNKKNITPIVLCILDGFGCREETENNAIAKANTPTIDALYTDYPNSSIRTDGLNVGLPEGQMGNSEVGHMNIGSGRVVMQSLPKIDESIASGAIKNIPTLQNYINTLKENNGTCHLMGLLSDGGVHSHMDHIITLAKIIAEHGIKVTIHAFLDGRDTPPQSALDYIETCESALKAVNAHIATVSGRYYAMDRDNRWDRVEKAYNTLVSAEGQRFGSATDAVEDSYKNNVHDEFVLPCVIGNYEGIQDGDGFLMANFRADRAREITQCLIDPDFSGFQRGKEVRFGAKLTMTEYADFLNPLHDILFPAERPTNTIGQVVSELGLKQLRIAETEKYAHVTFFLNGGAEEVFEGEDRILIPSPDVATYDLKPEMSAPEVTEKLVGAIASQKYSLIVVNFANMDMVGHTGIVPAAMKAAEQIDKSIAALKRAVESVGGVLLITADHGNAEMMVDPDTGSAHTAHTLFKVPFIVVGAKKNITLSDGRLCDIAPTALELMGVEKPKEMTGISLIN